MIIKEIEIKNFRSIQSCKISCNNLTVLIGRNGSGKSSFLSAIDIFYNISAKISKEDFFNRNIQDPIEIRISFFKLNEDEKREFSSYIRNEEIIVTKIIKEADGEFVQQYFAAAMQIPQFSELRKMENKRDMINAWKKIVQTGELSGLEIGRARSADDVEGSMAEYENSHRDLLTPIEKETQFFGPKSIGGGKLDNYTKFVLIPAVHKVSEEISGKKSAIYQMLDALVLRKINTRTDVQQFLKEFEEKAKTIFTIENFSELVELGNSISETLDKFSPGSKLNLNWTEIENVQPPIPEAKATLIEDNFEGEITYKGHGLQRALIVTLFQQLAKMATPEEATEETTPQEKKEITGLDLILAIEEPELYLHPSRCRYLSELLLKIADEKTGSTQNQIFYTSHSPYFVDLNRFDSVRLIKKDPTNVPVPCSNVSCFSLNEGAKELATICGVKTDTFSRDSFKVRALSVMNTIVNEGFFADKVVVVEGTADASGLWKLQEIQNKEWTKKGIVVVPAGGKNNIDRPVIIFRGLKIPTYFIFDGDSHYKRQEDKNDAKKRNHRYQRLGGVTKVVDFPPDFINDSYAVFNKNWEEAIKEKIGVEKFTEITHQVAKELGYEDCDKACKSIEGSSRLIELIYENKLRLPFFEQIIEKITEFN